MRTHTLKPKQRKFALCRVLAAKSYSSEQRIPLPSSKSNESTCFPQSSFIPSTSLAPFAFHRHPPPPIPRCSSFPYERSSGTENGYQILWKRSLRKNKILRSDVFFRLYFKKVSDWLQLQLDLALIVNLITEWQYK